jgi:hypothetical protein
VGIIKLVFCYAYVGIIKFIHSRTVTL